MPTREGERKRNKRERQKREQTKNKVGGGNDSRVSGGLTQVYDRLKLPVAEVAGNQYYLQGGSKVAD